MYRAHPHRAVIFAIARHLGWFPFGIDIYQKLAANLL